MLETTSCIDELLNLNKSELLSYDLKDGNSYQNRRAERIDIEIYTVLVFLGLKWD